MFDKLKKDLRRINDAVLLFSGGMESTLLLAVMRGLKQTPMVVQFREYMTREQLRRSDELIIEWGLEVYTYPPMGSYLIGKEKELAVVFEYAIGNTVLPSIRDVIPGSLCGADISDGFTALSSPIAKNSFILGSRKADRHFSFPDRLIPAERWEQDGTTFYAPLYEWTREDVKEGLKIYGLDSREVPDEESTNSIRMCDKCLNGTGKVFCPKEKRQINQVKWNRDANLQAFRNKYIKEQ